MRRRYAGSAALLLALGAVAACTDGTDGGDEQAPGASNDATGAGTDERDPASPVRRVLDWQPVEGNAAAEVVDAGASRIVVPQSGRRATLTGAARATVAAGQRRTFVDVLVGDGTAFLLGLDQQEERPAAITALDLATGEQRRVDTPTPAPDGASATGPHGFHYAAVDDQGRFCLATLPPGAIEGDLAWCAPPRHGWSSVSDTEAGVAFMTFDDRRPVSCRTLVRLPEDGGDPQQLEGVEPCTAWDVALTGTGQVWSTVPDENRVEQVEVHARVGDTTYHVGEGTRSTLTPCGDSVFWVRDSPGDAAPARLMRWTAEDRLEIAYQSPGRGPAFLSPPVCSNGDRLTVAAYGEGGDERVSATVAG